MKPYIGSGGGGIDMKIGINTILIISIRVVAIKAAIAIKKRNALTDNTTDLKCSSKNKKRSDYFKGKRVSAKKRSKKQVY